MHRIQLTYPGSRLRLADAHWDVAISLDRSLASLASQLEDAVIALNYREGAVALLSQSESREAWEKRQQRIGALAAEARLGTGADAVDLGDYERQRAAAQARVEEEDWRAGIIPRHYQFGLLRTYSRACIVALHTYGQLLKRMAADIGKIRRDVRLRAELAAAAAALKEAQEAFKARFPHLEGVRDTLQHMENRARGRDRNDKELELRMTPQGFRLLNLGSSDPTNFSATMSDGSVGTVEITQAAIEFVQANFQSILDAMPWDGPEQVKLL